MDKNIHSIEMFRCLLTPRHTASKTTRGFARRYSRQRERTAKGDKPPPGGSDFSGLLNVMIEAAGFAQKRGTGRFAVFRWRRPARCRSPPFPGF
jgi:hypothetical protein